jgi:hypothetical protein
MTVFAIKLIPLADTSPRELSALRSEAEEAVRRLRNVGHVGSIYTDAPLGSKGVAEDIGAFLVGIQPALITGVLETIKAVLLRPAQPQTKIKVEGNGVELIFDPRHLSLDEVANFVERVRAKSNTA